MTDRLSPEREAEILKFRDQCHPVTGVLAVGRVHDALNDLLAELAAVRAERDETRTELAKYVGAELTIAEEMAYLSDCLNAVHDLCNRAQAQAERSEQPLPVPEWVEQVRTTADGSRPDDPNDRRRRIYIDGKSDGWIDLAIDPETGEQDLAGITNPWKVATTRDVLDDTGSLREIGRCW